MSTNYGSKAESSLSGLSPFSSWEDIAIKIGSAIVYALLSIANGGR